MTVQPRLALTAGVLVVIVALVVYVAWPSGALDEAESAPDYEIATLLQPRRAGRATGEEGHRSREGSGAERC